MIETTREEPKQVEPEEKVAKWDTERKEIDFSTVNMKKLQKSVMKKQRKEKSRNARRADELTDALAAFSGL